MRLQCWMVPVLAATLVTVGACDCGWAQETRPDAGPPDAGPPDAGLPDAGCVGVGHFCSHELGPWCCDDLTCGSTGEGSVCRDCFRIAHACTSTGECCPGMECVDPATNLFCQASTGCQCLVLLP